MNPAVSIITATYNDAKFLRETITSVLKQHWKDYEYIIINDASTDETEAIAREFSRNDERVTVISLDRNGGVSQARNRGLELTSAPLIAFLDGDDVWHPHFLTSQISALQNEPADCIGAFCHSVNFQDGTRQIINKNSPRAGHYYLAQFLLGGLLCPPGNGSSLLIRRDAINRAGLFLKEIPPQEDFEMWLRMLSQSPKYFFCCNPNTLVERRRHSQSLTSRCDHLAGQEYILRTYSSFFSPPEQVQLYVAFIRDVMRFPRAITQQPIARWTKELTELLKDHPWKRRFVLAIVFGLRTCGRHIWLLREFFRKIQRQISPAFLPSSSA